ncbi:glycosyltransferase family 2 protein [Belliella pelovolcani]|uniref:Glycosyltransferase, GT2 family n=1 Tax=Belliella pelovolcani TaxID=529505 RepID=A0A1N7KWE3_9BACT|nr:glycosyltransferase [Belliella pelovolcani]SIS65806.1 Glycosyltransferase, GT2 family [Belliella pelovolcani]
MDSYLSSSDLNNSPLVTVAVITRNRADSLKRTLDAIKKLDYSNYEVLVVDNASTDHTKEVIYNSGYKYLFSKKNNGFAKTRQIAVDTAKGEYICWCDDDCVPDPDWIRSFLQCFQINPNLSLLGGFVHNINFPESLVFKGKSKLGLNGQLIFVENGYEAEYFGNLNLAVKRCDIHKINGYDNFFKGGYEEIDLAFRLKIIEKEVGFCFQARVKHYHNDSSFKKGRFFYNGQLSRIYFYLKSRHHLKDFSYWVFFKNELFILINDLKRSIRGIFSGIKKLDKNKIVIYSVELLNSALCRLVIPFLIVKSRK